MRLDDARESENVEDRRGRRRAGGGFPMGTGGLGIGGLLIVVVVSYFFGIDPMSLLSNDPSVGSDGPATGAPDRPPANDPAAVFASKILADTEDTWSEIFSPPASATRSPCSSCIPAKWTRRADWGLPRPDPSTVPAIGRCISI
jgi:predicted metalloprotease